MTDDIEPTTPEMESYEITLTRKIEVDFSDVQVQQMVANTELQDTEEAIGQTLLQQETENVHPEQKLLALDVQVDGPSDE